MDLIELAQRKELSPRKTASTHGGEYHSACPLCGGKDRFTLWPNEPGRDNVKGRYWCRQCNIAGDTLSFCIDVLGMSFKEARSFMRLPESDLLKFRPFKPLYKTKEYTVSSVPPSEWQTAVEAFLIRSEKNLEESAHAQELLRLRGLNPDTIERYRLGYNPKSEWIDRKSWGLPEEKVGEKMKKLWLPQGLIIPTLDQGLPIKLKIRRDEWHVEDKLPKYVEVPGSKQAPSLFGSKPLPIILVEAELDALLIMQVASDLCRVMALGGVSKLPDQQAHEILKSADLILFALDFDEAGKKAYYQWRSAYKQLEPWPVPYTKSPSDAYKEGLNVRTWVDKGLAKYARFKPSLEVPIKLETGSLGIDQEKVNKDQSVDIESPLEDKEPAKDESAKVLALKDQPVSWPNELLEPIEVINSLDLERLPPTPYSLTSYSIIHDWDKYIGSLRADIADGPKGCRARFGALQEDIRKVLQVINSHKQRKTA